MSSKHSTALSLKPRQCPMCLDDVEVDFISVLSQCKHEYCRECLIHYVTGTTIRDIVVEN